MLVCFAELPACIIKCYLNYSNIIYKEISSKIYAKKYKVNITGTFICNRYYPKNTLITVDVSQLKDKAKQFKAKPKSKEQVITELEEIEKRLGLKHTNSKMENTHHIVKRIGSLTNVLNEIRENEQE